MPDISKCDNNNCPIKNSCYRFTVKPCYMQSYASFEFTDSCSYYWNNGKCIECELEEFKHTIDCSKSK